MRPAASCSSAEDILGFDDMCASAAVVTDLDRIELGLRYRFDQTPYWAYWSVQRVVGNFAPRRGVIEAQGRVAALLSELPIR